MLNELRARLVAREFENSDSLLSALDQMSDTQKMLVRLAYQLGEDAGAEQAEEGGDLADDDLFECVVCGHISDIENSQETAEGLICERCSTP